MITLLLLVCATCMYGVVLHAHPVRGESHNQRNTTGDVATQSCSILTVMTSESARVSDFSPHVIFAVKRHRTAWSNYRPTGRMWPVEAFSKNL